MTRDCQAMSKRVKYSKELLKEAAAQSESIAGVLHHLQLRQAGGNQTHIARRLKEYEVNTSHFTGCGHNRGKTASTKKTARDILVVSPEGSFRPKQFHLHRAMLECDVQEVCQLCGVETNWNGAKLVLHIDHVDGNWLNNTLSHLRFLCPNCHSQTDTFGTKNKPSYSNW